MLYSLKRETEHERRKDKSTNKSKHKKTLRDNTHPLSPHPMSLNSLQTFLDFLIFLFHLLIHLYQFRNQFYQFNLAASLRQSHIKLFVWLWLFKIEMSNKFDEQILVYCNLLKIGWVIFLPTCVKKTDQISSFRMLIYFEKTRLMTET